MRKIKISLVMQVAPNCPSGYFEDVIGSGVVDNDVLLLDDDIYERLRSKYKTDAKRLISSVPYSEWPFWAKALKFFSNSEDKGIGDVIARKIGNENSEAFKRWYRVTFGKDCGCNGRQARWNAMYPLGHDGQQSEH